MKKIKNLFFTVLLTAIIAISFQACQMDDLNPIEPGVINSDISFSMKDEMTGAIIGDTAGVNQAILFIGKINNPNISIARYLYIWGDGSQNDSGIGNAMTEVHKYYNPNSYSVTLRAWDAANNFYEYTGIIHIVLYQGTVRPIFKVISATQVNSTTWDYTLGFLRAAVECSPSSSPFFVDTISNWTPESMSPTDTTLDGYYKKEKRFVNGTHDAFTYGGYWPTCYASIAPRLPFWSNIYYVDNGPNDRKMHAIFSGGVALTIGNPPTPNPLPGTAGDSLNLTTRFGVSANKDTIYVYFYKPGCSSYTNAYWVNNITGMNNNQTVYETPNYSDWWYAKFLKSALPINTALTFRYGSSSGLANMSSSYFWNPVQQWLEVFISVIGDGPVGKIGVKNYQHQ